MILARDDFQDITVAIFDEPCPATALKSKCDCLESVLKRTEVFSSLLDSLGQGALRLAIYSAWWCQFLPEQGMVDVAACVEIGCLLELRVLEKVSRSISFAVRFQCVIEVRSVCLMMLVVM